MKTQHLERKLFPHKSYRKSFLKIIFCAIATLFLWSSAPVMAQESACSDLKKVNNIDEMLYQFYTHLDSDCLFTMPLSELEEAWGIKILSDEREKQTGTSLYELQNSEDFKAKPYHSEVDAFYVEAVQLNAKTIRFTIHITKAYAEKHLTLFPEGNYPKLLPEPATELAPFDFYPCQPGLCDNSPLPRPQTPGVYQSERSYYWFNADKSHVISMRTRLTESIDRIGFAMIPPRF